MCRVAVPCHRRRVGRSGPASSFWPLARRLGKSPGQRCPPTQHKQHKRNTAPLRTETHAHSRHLCRLHRQFPRPHFAHTTLPRSLAPRPASLRPNSHQILYPRPPQTLRIAGVAGPLFDGIYSVRGATCPSAATTHLARAFILRRACRPTDLKPPRPRPLNRAWAAGRQGKPDRERPAALLQPQRCGRLTPSATPSACSRLRRPCTRP